MNDPTGSRAPRDVFPPRGKRGKLATVSRRDGSFGQTPRRLPHAGAFAWGLLVLSLATLGGLTACKTDSPAPGARQWFRCRCSYISDFDEPGRAHIDVCTDDPRAEEIAATCVRNDGVGIPTSCGCDALPRGPCAKSDRCRAAREATP
jgi:hypothetical protein